MKAALSFTVIVCIMFALLALPRTELDRATLLALTLGFVMLGAWLTGRAFARIHLPKVTGYLAFGILFGPSAWALVSGSMAGPIVDRAMPLISDSQLDQLEFIKMLAIGLIALTAGAEIELSMVFSQARKVGTLTVVAIVGVGLVIFAALFGLHSTVLTIVPNTTGAGVIVAIALLSLIAAGNSPSLAIALISELHAEGPLSRMTMMLTVCKDLLLIVLFATLVAVGRAMVSDETELSASFAISVAAQLFGSLGVGAIAGLLMAMLANRLQGQLVFFVIFVCFGFALLGDQDLVVPGTYAHFHFKPLLLALAAGMTMRNVAPKLSKPLIHTIEEMSLPVYALFFAVAGAQLQLDVFTVAATAMAVAAVVLIRAAAVAGLVTFTAARLKLDETWRRKLWLCLLPQAGVTLALTQITYDSFQEQPWSNDLQTLLLGLVAVHAVIGPILYRWALVRSGEVGKSTGTEPAH